MRIMVFTSCSLSHVACVGALQTLPAVLALLTHRFICRHLMFIAIIRDVCLHIILPYMFNELLRCGCTSLFSVYFQARFNISAAALLWTAMSEPPEEETNENMANWHNSTANSLAALAAWHRDNANAFRLEDESATRDMAAGRRGAFSKRLNAYRQASGSTSLPTLPPRRMSVKRPPPICTAELSDAVQDSDMPAELWSPRLGSQAYKRKQKEL